MKGSRKWSTGHNLHNLARPLETACKFTELHQITQDYTELQPNVPDYADLQGVAIELQGVAVEVRGGAPKNDSKVCYKGAIAFFHFSK